MNSLILRNVKQMHSYKFLYSAVASNQFCLLKYVNVRNNSIPESRSFSWVGFYSALSQSTPVITVQNALLELHGITGLPWWAVIMLTTFGIRSVIMFPLTVHQHQVLSRLVNINAGLGEVASELNKEVNVARRIYNWSEDHSKVVFRKNMRRIYKEQVVKNNCHPFKTSLIVLIQIPVWVCFSVSLRNLTTMSSVFHPGTDSALLTFKNEGILWFTDLTCPDPIFIPLMIFVMNLSLIEIHAMKLAGNRSVFQKVLLNGSRLITIIIAIAATINPSSVSFYWLCSSTFGLGQNLLLMAPAVRKLLRIPNTGKESTTPFSDISTNFKNRFKR